jgi:hypothetical protein
MGWAWPAVGESMEGMRKLQRLRLAGFWFFLSFFGFLSASTEKFSQYVVKLLIICIWPPCERRPCEQFCSDVTTCFHAPRRQPTMLCRVPRLDNTINNINMYLEYEAEKIKLLHWPLLKTATLEEI